MMNNPTEEEFLEWRQSRVAEWFFRSVERDLQEQMFNRQLGGLMGKSVDQLALETAERLGYAAGVLAVSSVRFSDL
jgi:hypothetical protein